MPLSLYDITIAHYIKRLEALSGYLETGAAHANGREEALLQARIFEDMLPLTYQIKTACGMAIGAAVKIIGIEDPWITAGETSFADLQERITKTVAFLETLPANCMDGMEDKEISWTVTYQGKEIPFNFTGTDYAFMWSIPQFHFHCVTAYNILRKEGIPLGKADFVGRLRT